jgi:hypothetical protein
MSLRGAQGSLRRGFARMVKPLKSGLATSRSREEELRDEREFERLFLLFEAFLHTDRSRPASASSTPSSSPSPTADVDLPLPLRQVVGDSDGDEEKKSKRKRRLSFGRERRKSVSKKKSEDDKKNEDDCGGSQTPKAVAIAAELGVGENGVDNKQKNQDGEETRQPVMKGKNEDDCGDDAEEEEHEMRFVVGLLNGYLALKRLGAGDKDLTFSLAHNNNKKEEERERRELEKLRGEVVLRMTSALADLGALPAAASTDAASAPQLSAAAAAARPSGVARHQSADYRIPASRSSPMMARQNRTSWRGRLRSKEKEKKAAAVSVEEQAGGKDKKPQQQPDCEERSGSTAQKSEEYRFPTFLRLRSCVGFANLRVC